MSDLRTVIFVDGRNFHHNLTAFSFQPDLKQERPFMQLCSYAVMHFHRQKCINCFYR